MNLPVSFTTFFANIFLLNRVAQQCAERMARTKSMSHSPKPWKYGENISYRWSSHSKMSKNDAAISATKAWYDEVKFYNYRTGKSNNPKKAVGHFTQVVWKDSRQLGVGVAYNGNHVYVCAEYLPAGNFNVQTSHKKQVLKA